MVCLTFPFLSRHLSSRSKKQARQIWEIIAVKLVGLCRIDIFLGIITDR